MYCLYSNCSNSHLSFAPITSNSHKRYSKRIQEGNSFGNLQPKCIPHKVHYSTHPLEKHWIDFDNILRSLTIKALDFMLHMHRNMWWQLVLANIHLIIFLCSLSCQMSTSPLLRFHNHLNGRNHSEGYLVAMEEEWNYHPIMLKVEPTLKTQLDLIQKHLMSP
jgi:hypothetical protein